uniref:Uncharacterized protein n=1 Tax=Magallana gigas TaxID=29159 RepID=K1Q5R1_MAGGI
MDEKGPEQVDTHGGRRYTSSSPSSTTTTSCTYSPPLDENWPHARSAPFTNVEDFILTTFRRKSPKKYEALNRRFTEPRVTATRRFKVLKALQKRIMQDMEQSDMTLAGDLNSTSVDMTLSLTLA